MRQRSRRTHWSLLIHRYFCRSASPMFSPFPAHRHCVSTAAIVWFQGIRCRLNTAKQYVPAIWSMGIGCDRVGLPLRWRVLSVLVVSALLDKRLPLAICSLVKSNQQRLKLKIFFIFAERILPTLE